MKLGLFMMPLHDPNRDYTKILQDDREAILLAEKLGYEEAWVGEHYSAATEPITDPLQFMATLIPVTKSIKFGTSVLNLPQHHPAQVAGNCECSTISVRAALSWGSDQAGSAPTSSCSR
jgi:alkanesulfonate monooxygenase SsuD/methylene tetrahydromethanopterin reductase-like flavin-dependent oxidoreductase (luciferase family)